MTYSPASSLIGYQPIRAGWRDVLTAHGAVPDVPMILATYDQWCKTLNIDPNLALAQACHEETYFTGERWTAENNPAGLGVTSSTTPPNPFKTPQEGIEAHIEHLCAYTYTTVTCPVDHAHMADRRHFMHEGFPDLAGLERSAHWAFPGTGYVASIASIANSIGGAPTMPRIIVSAGHEHIGSITSDPNGVIDPAALRGGTGANGEVQWTVACADALTALLHAAGVDVVRTDAIYHADVYGPDADLVVVLHYDGGAGTGRAQYCMASTVHSGPSTVEADSRADTFVADWYTVYCAQMGIAGDGPITVDMTQEYEGWYRSANTPMAILEHCLGADAAGIRADRPTPEASAAADFAALAMHFNLSAPPAPPPQFQIDGFEVGEGIAQLVGAIGDDGSNPRLRLLGKCLGAEHDEYLVTASPAPLNMRADLVVAVRFERGVLLWDKGRTPPPFDVRCPMTNEQVLPADDVLVQAVLENMRLAGVT